MIRLQKFRDTFKVPEWLSSRPGLDVGFRFVWSLVAPLDALLETMLQGVYAGRPGFNYTALPLIGRSRGILRGADDTDEEYAARLRNWLETWRQAGRAECLARQLHEVLPGRPRVRIASRLGNWVTVNADGSVATHEGISLNWDSLSHPERTTDIENWWSEMWIIIEDPWEARPSDLAFAGLLTPGDSRGISHFCRQEDVDIVKGQILQWKSAHSYVRCVIWSTDPADFDPIAPATANGRWGQWSIDLGKDKAGSGSRVASPRDSTTTRYWEPF